MVHLTDTRYGSYVLYCKDILIDYLLAIFFFISFSCSSNWMSSEHWTPNTEHWISQPIWYRIVSYAWTNRRMVWHWHGIYKISNWTHFSIICLQIDCSMDEGATFFVPSNLKARNCLANSLFYYFSYQLTHSFDSFIATCMWYSLCHYINTNQRSAQFILCWVWHLWYY